MTGTGLVAPPTGTAVTVTLADSNGSAVATTSDTCASPGTDADGECSVTFSSPSAGLVTGNASVSLAIDTETIVRDTAGNAGPGGSDGADKRFVDAYITINPPTATNNVTDPHTFTVNVFQDSGDGNGFVAVPDDTIVVVTLTDTLGATSSVSEDTCADPGTVAGSCTVTFTSPTSGTVTGHASVDLTIEGDSVHRETDGNAPNSGDAVKTFITGALKIVKNSTKGGLVATGGATFSVDGSLLADDFTVVDNDSNDGDPDVGEICVGGVTPGESYTVNETAAPDGYGDATETDVIITAVSGTCSTAVFGAGNTATFVNPPLFDIQVNYVDGGSGETSLVGTITCDNPTGDDDTAVATGWSDTLTVTDIEVPASGLITLTCTLVVDP